MFRQLRQIQVQRLFTQSPKLRSLRATPLLYTTSSTCQAQDSPIDTGNFKASQSVKSGDSQVPTNLRNASITRKKLHSRVLTDQEEAKDEKLAAIFSGLPEDESFGQFSAALLRVKRKTAKTKKKKHQRQSQDRKAEIEDEGDVFGTMVREEELGLPEDVLAQYRSRAGEVGEEKLEVEDKWENDPIPLSRYGQKGKDAKWYAKNMERLGKEGKVYEAIQMLEETMLKEDRVRPTEYAFTVVIGIVGRVGYTEKAFQLFEKMKGFGIIPEEPAYTALFNACANSPWKEDGLKRANDLCQLMGENDIEPNSLTIKAMVKAYSKLGDVQTALSIVDGMVDAGYKLDKEAWSHIFFACISDRETGFKHAIEMWRRMRLKITPNSFHYNLLLRAARDCGVGSEDYVNQLLDGSKAVPKLANLLEAKNKLPPPSLQPNHTTLSISTDDESPSLLPSQGRVIGSGDGPQNEDMHRKSMRTIVEDVTGVLENKGSSELAVVELDKRGLQGEPGQMISVKDDYGIHGPSILDMSAPNILNPRGIKMREGVVSLGSLETSESRLALLGGIPSILSHMKKDRAVPDIKTFSLLLDMISDTSEAEDDLLAAMKTHQIVPDVDFLNALIRRRCWRKDLASAKDVLQLFGRFRGTPDMMTFASLALGCKDYSSGLQLLNDMADTELVPTVNIYGILLRRSGYDFRYIKALCVQMQRQKVQPNESIIDVLENRVDRTRKAIVRKEKGLDVDRPFQRKDLSVAFKQFMLFYKPWLINMNLDVPAHPWSQFKQPSPDYHPDKSN